MRSLADVDGLVDALATLRSHWRRWGNDGFDAGEVKVARWLFVGQLALPGSSGQRGRLPSVRCMEPSIAPFVAASQLTKATVSRAHILRP